MRDTLVQIREIIVGLQCETSVKDTRQESFTDIILLIDEVV